MILNSGRKQKEIVRLQKKLNISKYMLQNLPSSNWLMSSRKEWMMYSNYSNVDIYDLFLHQRDIGFLANDVINFVKTNGLHFVEYYPNLMDNSAMLSTKIESALSAFLNHKTSNIQMKRIKEHFASTVTKHGFYISNIVGSQADINNLENIIYVHGNPFGLRQALLRRSVKKSTILRALVSPFNAPSIVNIDASEIKRKRIISKGGRFRQFQVSIPNNISYNILCHLMRSDNIMRDGIPIRKLYAKFVDSQSTNVSIPTPDSHFVPIYDVMKSVGILLLKAEGVVSPIVSRSLSFFIFKPEIGT